MDESNSKIIKRTESALRRQSKLTHITKRKKIPLNDWLKICLCRKFVQYLNEKKIKSADLAKLLNIPPSRVSEIVNYKINSYSIEQLLHNLESLSKHSPSIREYLNLVLVITEIPFLSGTKTKDLSIEIKRLVDAKTR